MKKFNIATLASFVLATAVSCNNENITIPLDHEYICIYHEDSQIDLYKSGKLKVRHYKGEGGSNLYEGRNSSPEEIRGKNDQEQFDMIKECKRRLKMDYFYSGDILD